VKFNVKMFLSVCKLVVWDTFKILQAAGDMSVSLSHVTPDDADDRQQ